MFFCASGSTTGRISSSSVAHAHRLQPQVLGPRELEEALHHLVEPADLALDDFDVLERALGGRRQRRLAGASDSPRPPAAATGLRLRRAPAAAADLRPQQLEVDHHRVERILHLVRDAGGQPAERHQLARIGDRRLHPRQVRQVARHEQHADELAVGARDRRASSAAARSSLGLRSPACTGPARLPRGQRLLDDRAVRMAARAAAPRSARPMASAGSVGCIAGLLKSSSPDGLNSATASSRCSTADCRFAFWPASTVRSAESCWLTVLKNDAELAELVARRQVERDAELALAEARQAAADHVNRPQQQLRQQRRDEHGHDAARRPP